MRSSVRSPMTRVPFNEPPARSTVQVAALPKQGLVEIEMIVLLNEQ